MTVTTNSIVTGVSGLTDADTSLILGSDTIVNDGTAVYDATTTASATCTVGSATAAFSAADVGKVCVVMAYTDTQAVKYGSITAVAANGLSCTAALSGSPGVLSSAIFIYGTDNKDAIDALLTSADIYSGVDTPPLSKLTVIQFPPGIICTTGIHVQPSGTFVRGFGNNTVGGKAKDFRHTGTSLVLCKFVSGEFWTYGSLGGTDPRGCRLEDMNFDACNNTGSALSGGGRTAYLSGVTGVRGNSTVITGGPTDRITHCNFLGPNLGNVAVISGDSKFTDNLVIGNGTGFAKIKVSNAFDVLISRNHVWCDATALSTGPAIWVSLNSGSTAGGMVTISDNEIDTTNGSAYKISGSGNSSGRGVSIRGGHVFNNPNIANNSGSVLELAVAAGSSLQGLIFKDVLGTRAYDGTATGEWAYLVDASGSGAGTVTSFVTGGCSVSGCNAMYNNITPTLDSGNIINLGVTTTPTHSVVGTQYTWATIPAATTLPAGFEVIVTDLGTGGGVKVKTDGTYWRPVNGSMVLYSRWTLLAAAMSTITAAAAAQCFVPTDSLQIPAGLLFPGCSIHVRAKFRRLGNTGGAGFVLCKLGTNEPIANPGTNNTVIALSMAATTNLDYVMEGYGSVVAATTWLSGGTIAPQGTATAGLTDKTTLFNTASLNYLSFEIANPPTADNFALLGYEIMLRG